MLNDVHISFAPFFPFSLNMALAALILLQFGLLLLFRRWIMALRIIGLSALLLALMNPILIREEKEPQKTVVAVVLDRSGSQNIGERAQQTEAARLGLEKAFAELPDVDTRFIDAAPPQENAEGTKIFAPLASALADVPPERVGAVVVVTDGIVHDIPQNLAQYGFPAPLHALITGHEGEIDRRIEVLEQPRFGLIGQDVNVTVKVIDSQADLGNARLSVKLDGEELFQRSVIVGQPVSFPVKLRHAGGNIIEVSVDELAGELTGINNRAVLTVEGVRDRLKVLLVSGSPNPGERAWRNLLKSDANVELVHFTILCLPTRRDSTPPGELALIPFPVEDLFGPKIKDFDLIIFDRYSNQVALPSVYLTNISDYVRAGGALLVEAAPDFADPTTLFDTPLNAVLPSQPTGEIIEQPFSLKPTAVGRRHPVLRDLAGMDAAVPPWASWFRIIGTIALRGNVLIDGDRDLPVLLLSHEGKGRVIFLASDQIWLWARDYAEGGPYLDLMRHMVHWLMKEPSLEEEALRAKAKGHELTVERQSLQDTIDKVELTPPIGPLQTLELASEKPGLWQSKVTVENEGLYRLKSGALTTLINVGADNPIEFQEVVSTLEKLRPLAENSGGSIRRLAGNDHAAIHLPRPILMSARSNFAGADYIGISRTQASITRSVSFDILAIGLLGLLILLAPIILSWLLEARRGMGE